MTPIQYEQLINELRTKINTLEIDLTKAEKKLKEVKKILQSAVRTLGQ